MDNRLRIYNKNQQSRIITEKEVEKILYEKLEEAKRQIVEQLSIEFKNHFYLGLDGQQNTPSTPEKAEMIRKYTQ